MASLKKLFRAGRGDTFGYRNCAEKPPGFKVKKAVPQFLALVDQHAEFTTKKPEPIKKHFDFQVKFDEEDRKDLQGYFEEVTPELYTGFLPSSSRCQFGKASKQALDKDKAARKNFNWQCSLFHALEGVRKSVQAIPPAMPSAARDLAWERVHAINSALKLIIEGACDHAAPIAKAAADARRSLRKEVITFSNQGIADPLVDSNPFTPGIFPAEALKEASGSILKMGTSEKLLPKKEGQSRVQLQTDS